MIQTLLKTQFNMKRSVYNLSCIQNEGIQRGGKKKENIVQITDYSSIQKRKINNKAHKHDFMKYHHIHIYKAIRWVLQGSNNNLHLQVVLKTVLSFFSTLSTHLVSTKGNCSIKCIKAIYPHCSNLQCSSQCICSVYVFCEDPSCKAITCVICSLNYLTKVPGINMKISTQSKAKIPIAFSDK